MGLSVGAVLLLLLLALALALPADAATYYVSPTGSDQASGTSVKQAWKTIDRVNKATLHGGDQVLFCAGGVFTGSLTFVPPELGAPEGPITISSLGPKRATIFSPDKPAISAPRGWGWIAIRDLILKGGATGGKKGHDGIQFGIAHKKWVRHHGITIKDVDISGFGGDGIAIGGWDDTLEGYDGVVIDHVVSHDNFGDGIATVGQPENDNKDYPNRGITIRDCTAYNNHSGTGIVVAGFEGGEVRYCRAYGNAGKDGGVGIWAWCAKDIVIDHCISSDTHTGGGDGDGFDLDGGCVDCTIQNCLSYDNDGWGYMHCDYPAAPPTHGNVIRDCISINDGQKDTPHSAGFGLVTWGSGLDDCVIENNISLALPGGPKPDRGGGLFTVYIASSQKGDTAHIRNCIVRNNIDDVPAGAKVPFVANDYPGLTPDNVTYIGNSYLAPAGPSPGILEGKTRYDSIDKWHEATKQESGAVQDTGFINALPRGFNYRLTDPHALDRYPLMKSLPSYARGKRIDMRQLGPDSDVWSRYEYLKTHHNSVVIVEPSIDGGV